MYKAKFEFEWFGQKEIESISFMKNQLKLMFQKKCVFQSQKVSNIWTLLYRERKNWSISCYFLYGFVFWMPLSPSLYLGGFLLRDPSRPWGIQWKYWFWRNIQTLARQGLENTCFAVKMFKKHTLFCVISVCELFQNAKKYSCIFSLSKKPLINMNIYKRNKPLKTFNTKNICFKITLLVWTYYSLH